MCEDCRKEEFKTLKVIHKAYIAVMDDVKEAPTKRGEVVDRILAKLTNEQKHNILRKIYLPDVLEKIEIVGQLDQMPADYTTKVGIFNHMEIS